MTENDFVEDIIARELYMKRIADLTLRLGAKNGVGVSAVYAQAMERERQPKTSTGVARVIADTEITCSNAKYKHGIHDEVIRQKFRKLQQIEMGLIRLGQGGEA